MTIDIFRVLFITRWQVYCVYRVHCTAAILCLYDEEDGGNGGGDAAGDGAAFESDAGAAPTGETSAARGAHPEGVWAIPNGDVGGGVVYEEFSGGAGCDGDVSQTSVLGNIRPSATFGDVAYY